VRADALAIQTDTGLSTATAAGSAVLLILLGVDTFATTGGLTTKTFAGAGLAVLIRRARVSARTTVVSVCEDGDALVRARATDATSLALHAHAGTIDARGELRALETTDTTVVVIDLEVSIAATALAGAARLTGTATVVAATAIMRVIGETDADTTTARVAGGAGLATDTTVLGIALKVLATGGADGGLLTTTTATLDAGLTSVTSVAAGSAVTSITEEVLAGTTTELHGSAVGTLTATLALAILALSTSGTLETALTTVLLIDVGGTADAAGTHLENREGAVKLNNSVAHAGALDTLGESRARLATLTTVIAVGLQVAATPGTEPRTLTTLAHALLTGDTGGARVTARATVLIIRIGVDAAGGASGHGVGRDFRIRVGG
jgi:hypothetical protein